jgi:hypothetical protein
MPIFIRFFAWLLAAAVTFATLGPPGLRPHSDLGLAYRNRRWAIAAIAVVLIGVLELMQFWAPGRHARLDDFLVDAGTACIGFALAAVADWIMARLRASSTLTN